MLKIGIDGHAYHGRRTGVGRMVYELSRVLDRIMDAEFHVYTNKDIELPPVTKPWIIHRELRSWARKFKANLWLKTFCGPMCDRDGIDVFWATSSFLPRMASGIKTVMMVYDLNFSVVPSSMPLASQLVFNLFFVGDARRADRIVAISKGTSDRLAKLCKRGADVIVYPGVDSRFVRPADVAIQSVLSHHGISQPYLMALSTWEPRKNLHVLIKAFERIRQKGALPSHALVLAGGRGWKDKELAKVIQKTRHVLALGFVNDEDLPALYAGADLFIFPSLYEGYGMPVAEAVACGSRVLASDVPEIREAGGTTVQYVNPDAYSLENSILSLVGSPRHEEPNERRTWEEAGVKLADCLVTVVRKN